MREEVLFRMVKRYLSIVTCSLLFREDERVRGQMLYGVGRG